MHDTVLAMIAALYLKWQSAGRSVSLSFEIYNALYTMLGMDKLLMNTIHRI
jgi:hypothetical protein